VNQPQAAVRRLFKADAGLSFGDAAGTVRPSASSKPEMSSASPTAWALI
jgi:hypothetical protein